jgi:hypothetical protein
MDSNHRIAYKRVLKTSTVEVKECPLAGDHVIVFVQ